MKKLFKFNFNGYNVRAMMIHGKPYFVGNDIAKALGYKSYRKAIVVHVSKDDKHRSRIRYAGQNRLVTMINEYGVFDLCLHSRAKNAKKFQKWITHKVVPAIYNTGDYIKNPKYALVKGMDS